MPQPDTMPAHAALPKATWLETLGVFAGIVGPTIAKGVIMRRPKSVALAERLDLDLRAVRRMQRLRNKYGSGPLLLRMPARAQAVVLAPQHVHRILAETPEPFATAAPEKRAMLSHLEPRNVLISHGSERTERRRFNEHVLESQRPAHRLAENFLTVLDEEADFLLEQVRRRGTLHWEAFAEGWFRMVRRVVLGEAASDDHELSAMTAQLRSAANWGWVWPQRRKLQEQFFARLRHYLARAEAGSLASVVAAEPTNEATEPEHQVPQWLFAFDPAGMATFRGLALLASHPEHAERARAEIHSHPGAARQYLPYLRATILESLRLWPTTPMVLRQSTQETTWDGAVLPADTSLLIFAPFFHRDDQHVDAAHRFAPALWLEERSGEDWPLIPFSDGPGVCPGRNLVLLLTSNLLARLTDRDLQLQPPSRLDAHRPLPGTLNPYSLRFQLRS